ncbi:hypothetical protein EV193_105164 [Herbihabitans rhizosphaerae]|uniref:Uncharacterized protein n=1 Tax=Herbihabitans rhizosphaerae TaxID=1872711 RepID=A0A4Q7KMR7_9PSEU|nr:DUF6882 domain-containing protein [Herbihabitans rhizosphaerae]RZS37606.1 hypothetical protein EV193_105164 [Herbihabitans rhizosphaerae]
MDFPGLQAVADRSALYAALRQTLLSDYLEETLGEHRWGMNMEQGTFTFSQVNGDRTIAARAHLVASIAPGPRSMMWGWAHPQSGADNPVRRIRELGEQHRIADLTTAELPFTTDAVEDALGQEIAALAHVVGAAAVEATRLSPYYSAPASGGTRIVFLLEGLDVPRPTITHIMTRTVPLLQAGEIRDHRSAVFGLAQHTDWGIAWNQDRSQVQLTDPASGTATIGFDQYGRITGISGDLKPAGQR